MDFLRISPFGGVQTPIFSRRAFGAPGVAQVQGGSMPLTHKDFLRISLVGGVQIPFFPGAPSARRLGYDFLSERPDHLNISCCHKPVANSN